MISQDNLLQLFKICEMDYRKVLEEKFIDAKNLKSILNDYPLEPENYYDSEIDMRFCQSSQNDMSRHYK